MKKFDLAGVDGNAFSVMNYVCGAMHEAFYKARKEQNELAIKAYNSEARDAWCKDMMSGNYDRLLALSCAKIEEINLFMEQE